MYDSFHKPIIPYFVGGVTWGVATLTYYGPSGHLINLSEGHLPLTLITNTNTSGESGLIRQHLFGYLQILGIGDFNVPLTAFYHVNIG
jgi:hypothetical protein